MCLAAGSFRHVHPSTRGAQVLVERFVENITVDEAAAHVQRGRLAVHVQRDVFPLRVHQLDILKRDDVARAVGPPVHQLECISSAVGKQLELPALAGTFDGDQSAAGRTVLAQACSQGEALVVLNLLHELLQSLRFDWGKMVEADEAIRRGVRVRATEQFHPDGPLCDSTAFE